MHAVSTLQAVFAAAGLCVGGLAIAVAVSAVTAPLSPRIAVAQPAALKALPVSAAVPSRP